MKHWPTLISLVMLSCLGWAQSAASLPTVCSKNVSFAVAENGQPVPAIPKFTAKWLENKSHREHYSNLCFSQIPAASLTNYVVVFSTSEAAFNGLTPLAHTYSSAAAPGHEGPGAASSYGGTWDYVYKGVKPPPTTESVDLKRDDKPKSLEVRAFDQSGRTISRYTLSAFSSREKLLEKVLSDVVSDAPPADKRKAVAAAMSVYYINCDVDSPPENATPKPPTPPPAERTAATPAPPPPPPKPELDIWSRPEGADIFLDGGYVGKTPYALTVTPGSHTVDLRKKDFGMWQQRVVVTNGKHQVGAYLERKVLDLF